MTKKSGTKKMARKVAASMPPMTPVPMAFWPPEPAPLAMASGSDAEDEGQRGHQDRAQPLVRGADGRFDQVHAVLEIFLGELDDQNRVLGRETDGGEQADLEKDVVGQAAPQAWPGSRRKCRAAPPA